MQPEMIPQAAPPVLGIYGQDSKARALACELALDGLDARQISDPAMFGAVDLIVFAHTSKRGAGLGALRALRQGELAGSGVRVLWIGNNNVIDTLRAFDAGPDDVIRTPFVYAELLARVRALLRRNHATPSVLRCGALAIDPAARTATYRDTPIALRRLEYLLLVHLARNPERVHTKAELLREVWGYRADGLTRTVDTHACRLRRALDGAGAGGWIHTTRGVGYRLAPTGYLRHS
jgi:DNA-binding response OmpR family regulator